MVIKSPLSHLKAADSPDSNHLLEKRAIFLSIELSQRGTQLPLVSLKLLPLPFNFSPQSGPL